MDILQKVKKRNGEVVDFDQHKIMLAIQKSFFATRGTVEEGPVRTITENVINELQGKFPSVEYVPSVEDIQNIVERKIMEQGFFDVAKGYILYRYEHAKDREEKKKDVLKRIEENRITVVKRSGKVEPFSMEKIRSSLAYAARGYEDTIDIDGLAEQCRNEVYDNMPTSEIARSLVMVTRSFIELDPAYSKVASRLLLAKLYKDIIGSDIDYARLQNQYREAFVNNIQRGVGIGRFDKRMLAFDLEALAQKLNLERDDLFRYLGTQVLYDRYLARDIEKDEVLETPQAFWMRVAMGVAVNENEKERTEWAMRFYDMLSTFRYVPSTPTLFHAGMPKAQLASCFLYTVGDDLEAIFKSYGDMAQLLKWSGGTAVDWTGVRGTGALIKSTGVESQGVIPFLKIANDVTISINRSGRRRGANCVYLEPWHYDIEEFLELRKNTGDERRRAHDMNTASWIPDLFMKRVRDDGDWTLFSPEEVPELHETYGKKFDEHYTAYEKKADAGTIRLWKRLKARELWKKMLAMLFETGHPWITFKDPSNIRSPQDHVGVVHNSNLCTEITLNNSAEETAVCNLGWINFAEHVTDGAFDERKVAETVQLGMRMLDNVIDANFYPTKETNVSNLRHRPVGLGVGGFHDALYKMNITFDSEAAVEFADRSMEVISYHAILASSDLARERGSYETFKGSKWDRGILPMDTLQLLEAERGERVPVSRRSSLDWTVVRDVIKKNGMRNSNCMAIAPTATTSNIVGAIPSIEPIYKNIYVKSNMSGDFTIVNPYLVEDLKRLGLWSKEMLGKLKFNDGNIMLIGGIPDYLKEKYKEVFQINPKWLIRAAAHRGKWIDQSQSLNIFFMSSSGKQLSEVYHYAWEMGLKTTYYLRTLAVSQVEKSTLSVAEHGSTHVRVHEPSVVMVAAEQTAHKETHVLQEHQNTIVSEMAVREPMPSVPRTKPISVAPGILGEAHTMGPKLCNIDDPSCESCQ
ncbi:MAG: ribonucleoside-diphosphate reductase subunit alpha [Candidatus Ryanbacteria bacterium RIFCSPHIGHO2_02_FULL_45_13b]|uniref:Ribonucleoside-diphosphate reductase n=1 Tax=Candidatus Ryanbacteria bacterium RIFCSPHIGHO2_02_FULL_45_13b TaxID=1802117 RepID=A0A1G2G7U0_9BACT|nr:MAG: ribonucleoside-diphosphate reductase subunit alpha [Candidatus Ryanbacteria bacterium RIFCSPHIGHO2_02_FULL_45_13b]